MESSSKRRQRLHELLIALIQRQDDLELIDPEGPRVNSGRRTSLVEDPAQWMDRNKRILNKYQALIRSALTLDALMESEGSYSGPD